MSSSKDAVPDVDSDDYYAVLGLRRGANADEIKRAYRKAALKWHPDKNPDDKKRAKVNFQKISEAYDVLSDEKKKAIYDRSGKRGLAGGGGGGGGGGGRRSSCGEHFQQHFNFVFRDPEEIFKEFFGGTDPFADVFGGSASPHLHPHSARHFDSVFREFDQIHRQSQAQTAPPTFGGTNGASSPGGGVGADFMTNPGFNPFFDMGSPFGNGGSGFSSHTTFSSMGGPGTGSSNVRSTSTSTKMVNGKRVKTTRRSSNGQTDVTVEEDGKLVSHTINGVQQLAIEKN